MESFETVIGLEVHLQLSTKTKIFCSCANQYGCAPNTNVCPVCLGLPGTLPVLNHQALLYPRFDVKFNLACCLPGGLQASYPETSGNVLTSQGCSYGLHPFQSDLLLRTKVPNPKDRPHK